MKYFFRGLRIGLGIGIPLTVMSLFFLHVNKQELLPDLSKISQIEEDSEELWNTEQEPEDSQPEQIVNSSPGATLAFAGDVHFSEQYLEAYDKSGISAIADEEMLSYMQNADLFILNEEFPFSLRGEPMEDKQYTFRIDPKYVKIFQDLGTDIAGIGNNHILDFGQSAFEDTIDTLKQAGIAYAGGGKNLAEASAPVVREINGQTFAFFAATRVSPSYSWYASDSKPGVLQTYDPKTLNNAIAEAEKQYDHTIVFVHWGIERNEMPEDYQRSLAKGYIDAGADLVVGAHPHVLQGFEYYQGVPIVYSLGNYLFGNRQDETLLLNAEFDENGELSLQLIPCKRTNGVLVRLQNPTELFEHLRQISFDVTISEGGILVP